MIVMTLTDCPPKVRGDLSKWLYEINTGVYVGELSARVREELWKRVCENVRHGQATMVFSSNCEQKIEFKVHNTSWQQVDLDGVTLMRHPIQKREAPDSDDSCSDAARWQKVRKINTSRSKKAQSSSYVILDVETTGLSVSEHQIIEIGILHIQDGQVLDSYSSLLSSKENIPEDIVQLTGIDSQLLRQKGRNRKEVLEETVNFIGNRRLVGHNIRFDLAFLKHECQELGIPFRVSHCTDTLYLARRQKLAVQDYKLRTLTSYFNIRINDKHRALDDCKATHQLYEELMKKRDN